MEKSWFAVYCLKIFGDPLAYIRQIKYQDYQAKNINDTLDEIWRKIVRQKHILQFVVTGESKFDDQFYFFDEFYF